MEYIIAFFIFVFGTMIGSFLNVAVLRKNTGESVIWEGSHCFSCGHKLGTPDLVPVFSFLFSKGHCRYCGSKISWQYPVVEAVAGVLALLTYWTAVPSPYAVNIQPYGEWLFYFAAFCALMLVAVYDYRQKIIDTHFLLIFGAFSLVPWIWRGFEAADLIAAFVIALFFYLMWKLSDGRWMGRGDANLAFPLALFVGWPISLAMLFVSFWLGGVFGIALLLLRNKKYGLKSEIPFGPFLAGACFLVWYFGAFFEGFLVW